MSRGKLYLVPVPIGNLKDITLRALEVLKQVDRILAEDTRTSGILLTEYEIDTPLISYHQHNEQSRVEKVLSILEANQNVALITDAGMPCISDPGSIIVEKLIVEGFEVIALPGANAAITCLAASGLNTDQYTYLGFLPLKGKLRADQLDHLSRIEHTVIIYEAPHRILKTLVDLIELDLGERKLTVGRELTKRYETYLRTTVKGAYDYYQEEKPRGEFVLILEGLSDFKLRNPELETEDFLTQEKNAINDLKKLIQGGMHTKSAANFIAEKYQMNKNKLYRKALEIHEET